MEVEFTPTTEVPKMKYRVTTAANVNNGSVDCMWYEIQDKGVVFGTDEDNKEIKGYLPTGTFGAILPL
jgi:hypothetical protein